MSNQIGDKLYFKGQKKIKWQFFGHNVLINTSDVFIVTFWNLLLVKGYMKMYCNWQSV